MGAKVRATGIKGGVTAGRASPTVAKRIMATARRTTSARTETNSTVASSNKEVIKSHTALMATNPSTTRLLTAKDLAMGVITNSSPTIMVTKTGTRRVARATVKTSVVKRDLVPKLGIRASLASMTNSLATTMTEVMAGSMVDRLLLTITLPSLVRPRRTTLTQSRAVKLITTRRSSYSRKWHPRYLKLP